MKKSLIAIAALAAVGAASAQSSVTLYGLADINYGQTKVTTERANYAAAVSGNNQTSVQKITGFNTSNLGGGGSGGLQGSRLGVKGTEDLGNGLQAVFNYEIGFEPVAGTFAGNGFNRRSVIGLAGGWGSVMIGKDYTPLYNIAGAVAPDGGSSYDTVGNVAGVFDGGLAAITARANGVFYTGNFSGVGVQAFWGKRTDTNKVTNYTTGAILADGKIDRVNGYGVGVTYGNGPLLMGGAWQQFKGGASTDGVTATSFRPKKTEWALGGSYDFGPAKLYTSYANISADDKVNGLSQKDNQLLVGFPKYGHFKADQANIGVTVPFGAASMVAGYGYTRVKLYDANGVTYGKGKGHNYLIGANYAFSKRTDLYARYNQTSLKLNDAPANVYIGKNKVQNIAIGMRHKF